MMMWMPTVACLLLWSTVASAGTELSMYNDNFCDPNTSSWTRWFNTQNPTYNKGNDVEDLFAIRARHEEVAHCDVVTNVEYLALRSANDNTVFYQTLINKYGLFCMGTPEAPCPDYRVRFCCHGVKAASISECGQTFNSPFLHAPLRIVNGLEAKPHSFPWAVSLQYRGQHDCGGVIIDKWHILTAAHCLDYSNDLPNYYARVGAHNRYSSGQLMPIAELTIHPNYDEHRSTNDIGIIRLATPIIFSSTIQPICLVDNIVDPPLDATVYVAGWGNTAYNVWDSASPVLLQARLRVISDCSMYVAYTHQEQICTTSNGPIDKDHGSCQGDSGGGMFYLKNNRWYAAGVVSYAIGCGQQQYPTVFTKTSAYVNWIRTITSRAI